MSTNQPTATMNWLMLRGMLKACSRAVHKNDDKYPKPSLEWIHVEIHGEYIKTTATDGRSLVTLKGDIDECSRGSKFLLAPKSLTKWLTTTPNRARKCSLYTSTMTIVGDDGTSCDLETSREVNTFPRNYRDTIPYTYDSDWTCNAPSGVDARYLSMAGNMSKDIQAQGFAMQVANSFDPIRLDFYGHLGTDSIGVVRNNLYRLCDGTMVIMPLILR